MKLPAWLAAIPAILIATIFAGRAFVQMGQASKAITGGDTSSHTTSLSCVSTYGINLANSQYYVPEGQEFVPQQKVEVSTVLSGMVRNDCPERLKYLRIPIDVKDDSGKRGNGVVTVEDLNPGEAKPFSKAWMGRMTSYDIGKIR